MVWRRNHSDSREADTRRRHRRRAATSNNNGTSRINSSVATSRLHNSRQQMATLLVGVFLFLLLTTVSRWNLVIVSSPTSDADTMMILPQTEKADHQFPSQATAKLRFDWTNMTLSSDLAKRIHAHQNNCSLPLAPNRTLNPFGLGSSLHSWSNRACGDLARGVRTLTTNTAKEPWIWLDETQCDTNAVSPLSCYFPSMELQCPNDVLAPNTARSLPFVLCSKFLENILGNNTTYNDNMVALRAATTEYMFHNVSRVVIDEAERQLRLVFPAKQGVVPQKLITVHVRWGDKIHVQWGDKNISEMKKVPIQDYINGVKRILVGRIDNNQEVNIFLATEDPNAVQEFKEAAPQDWNIYVDQYFHDMKDYRLMKDYRPEEEYLGQNNNVNAKQTKGKAGLISLGSLLLAMEADDFVLTTASNWSRLMNELRKNVLDPRCNFCTNMVDLRKGKVA